MPAAATATQRVKIGMRSHLASLTEFSMGLDLNWSLYRTIGDASIGSASADSSRSDLGSDARNEAALGFALSFSTNTILVFGALSNVPIPAMQKATRDAKRVATKPNAPIAPVLSSSSW
jgi:hypothetical protein